MPKVGKWKKIKKTSKQTVWRNTISKEEVIVKKSSTYPVGGWESNVADGIRIIAFQTRAEAESDAVAYMRNFPEGEKTYYAKFEK